MLKKITFCCMLILFSGGIIYAQNTDLPRPQVTPPGIAIKTNLLYDATTTFNLGTEFRIASRWTVDFSANYNPWTFSGNKKIKHIAFQPEFRYWICEPFNRHFIGIHAHYAYYNAGNIKLPLDLYPTLQDHRFQGWLTGAGFTYGYQWYLSPRWNLEASLGLGYAYLYYDKYECETCGDHIDSGHKHYFGPTKAALSLIYIIH